jgi:hypothetical protein
LLNFPPYTFPKKFSRKGKKGEKIKTKKKEKKKKKPWYVNQRTTITPHHTQYQS